MHRTAPCAPDWQRWQQRQQQSGRPPGRTSPSPLRHLATFFPAPFPPPPPPRGYPPAYPPSRKLAQRKANMLTSNIKANSKRCPSSEFPTMRTLPQPALTNTGGHASGAGLPTGVGQRRRGCRAPESCGCRVTMCTANLSGCLATARLTGAPWRYIDYGFSSCTAPPVSEHASVMQHYTSPNTLSAMQSLKVQHLIRNAVEKQPRIGFATDMVHEYAKKTRA
jgi:hypothetical protein